jgi:hypothetical protein
MAREVKDRPKKEIRQVAQNHGKKRLHQVYGD